MQLRPAVPGLQTEARQLPPVRAALLQALHEGAGRAILRDHGEHEVWAVLGNFQAETQPSPPHWLQARQDQRYSQTEGLRGPARTNREQQQREPPETDAVPPDRDQEGETGGGGGGRPDAGDQEFSEEGGRRGPSEPAEAPRLACFQTKRSVDQVLCSVHLNKIKTPMMTLPCCWMDQFSRSSILSIYRVSPL